MSLVFSGDTITYDFEAEGGGGAHAEYTYRVIREGENMMVLEVSSKLGKTHRASVAIQEGRLLITESEDIGGIWYKSKK